MNSAFTRLASRRGLRLLLAALVVSLVTAGGCARIEQENRVIKLDQAVRLYTDSIRWGNFETAAGLIQRRGVATSAAVSGFPLDVRVTSHAAAVLTMNEARDEATVSTSFEYYVPGTNKVRSITQTDVWWFDAGTERWYMDGALPIFRP